MRYERSKFLLILFLFPLSCAVFYQLSGRAKKQEEVELKEEVKEKLIEKGELSVEKAPSPNIGIHEKDREASITILNTVLADEFVLLVQTLNYHWNLVGPEFNDYHKLFDDQYHKIFEMIDAIAERVRSVGGIALGSMAALKKAARLEEDTGEVPAPKIMIQRLLKHHESLITSVRGGVNETARDNRDIGTSNFLTDLLEKHEKIAWMLRSLTEK